MFAIDIQDQILDKLNTLIVVLNKSGSIEYVSKSAQQLLGYNSQDLLGNAWWEITRFSKPEGEEVKTKLLNSFAKQNIDAQTFEHELKTSAGGHIWIKWNVSYLNEEQLIGVGNDITDNKLNEKRLLESNSLLLQQNKDVTDSLYYAQRIQQSILQTQDQLKTYFEDSFLLYKPKDIVSGDYYKFYEDDLFKYIAVIDCTGHGVPGAMMSMVANSMFKEVFENKKISSPAKILQALDCELEKTINKNQDEKFNDGMDVALISINKATNELMFSGAFRSILIVRESEIIELKGNRYPIGYYSGIEKEFTNEFFQLKKDDQIYLYTDGYNDQFGGEKNKKLNKANFKELLLTINLMHMEEQEAFLEYAFNNWKQNEEQTDDILIVGIKI
jgi:PAS domain S-box-containing protein